MQSLSVLPQNEIGFPRESGGAICFWVRGTAQDKQINTDIFKVVTNHWYIIDGSVIELNLGFPQHFLLHRSLKGPLHNGNPASHDNQ